MPHLVLLCFQTLFPLNFTKTQDRRKLWFREVRTCASAFQGRELTDTQDYWFLQFTFRTTRSPGVGLSFLGHRILETKLRNSCANQDWLVRNGTDNGLLSYLSSGPLSLSCKPCICKYPRSFFLLLYALQNVGCIMW